jgi:hypothetical protein
MRRTILVFSFLLLVLLTCQAAWAQDHDDMDVSDAKINPKRLAEAVKKGVAWLKGQQKTDGSWLGNAGTEGDYPGGCTALVLFALLKCGVDRNDAAIIKGFNFCFNVPNKKLPADPNNPGQAQPAAGNWEHKTYSVSCLILALEARYAPNEKKDAPKPKTSKHDKWVTTPFEKKVRDNFQKKATPQDRKLMNELVEWLLKQQQANVWRYPGPAQDGNVEDASNTQYSMLALNSARRLGYPIQAEVWAKVADYFIKYQEKQGPQVEWFPIPGADFSVAKLKKMADKVLKDLRKRLGKERRTSRGKKDKSGEIDKDGPKTTPVIEDPYQKYGPEKADMFARGWGYIPKGKAPKYQWMETICGSMTTSGVAALMITKAGLEGTSGYRRFEKKINKSIRDGCAWLAHNFTVTGNPNRGGYHYYFLYGLERVGVLTLCRMLGKHDWYEEGANHLLGAQSANGEWPATAGESALMDTCFALLFLKRATTPIVQIPETEYTGQDLFGPRQKPKPKEK